MVLSLGFFVGSVLAAECVDLFVPFKEGEATLTSSQRQILEKLQGRKTHQLLALVTLNAAAVGKSAVNLNLTADKQFRASRMTGEPGAQSGRLTWKGQLDEGAGSVLFTVLGENLTGTISTRAATYQVRPLGSGLHAIVRLNPSEFPPDHPGKE